MSNMQSVCCVCTKLNVMREQKMNSGDIIDLTCDIHSFTNSVSVC